MRTFTLLFETDWDKIDLTHEILSGCKISGSGNQRQITIETTACHEMLEKYFAVRLYLNQAESETYLLDFKCDKSLVAKNCLFDISRNEQKIREIAA